MFWGGPNDTPPPPVGAKSGDILMGYLFVWIVEHAGVEVI